MPHVAIVPIKTTSPERRVTQKEIIAGEERPKYLAIKQQLEATAQGMEFSAFSDTNSHQMINFNLIRYPSSWVTHMRDCEENLIENETFLVREKTKFKFNMLHYLHLPFRKSFEVYVYSKHSIHKLSCGILSFAKHLSLSLHIWWLMESKEIKNKPPTFN